MCIRQLYFYHRALQAECANHFHSAVMIYFLTPRPPVKGSPVSGGWQAESLLTSSYSTLQGCCFASPWRRSRMSCATPQSLLSPLPPDSSAGTAMAAPPALGLSVGSWEEGHAGMSPPGLSPVAVSCSAVHSPALTEPHYPEAWGGDAGRPHVLLSARLHSLHYISKELDVISPLRAENTWHRLDGQVHQRNAHTHTRVGWGWRTTWSSAVFLNHCQTSLRSSE